MHDLDLSWSKLIIIPVYLCIKKNKKNVYNYLYFIINHFYKTFYIFNLHLQNRPIMVSKVILIASH